MSASEPVRPYDEPVFGPFTDFVRGLLQDRGITSVSEFQGGLLIERHSSRYPCYIDEDGSTFVGRDDDRLHSTMLEIPADDVEERLHNLGTAVIGQFKSKYGRSPSQTATPQLVP
jgi:hypothetical protein